MCTPASRFLYPRHRSVHGIPRIQHPLLTLLFCSHQISMAGSGWSFHQKHYHRCLIFRIGYLCILIYYVYIYIYVYILYIYSNFWEYAPIQGYAVALMRISWDMIFPSKLNLDSWAARTCECPESFCRASPSELQSLEGRWANLAWNHVHIFNCTVELRLNIGY